EFISLQFVDLLGVPKEVIIPFDELEDALTDGIWFDGSSIEGFARIHESDLFLKPDISTYALVPWLKENGKTARVICDIYKSDGEPFEDDPRYILKKITAEAYKMGYQLNIGPELEFYLFKQDDTLKISLLDSGGYFDLTSYGGYKVIKEITTALRSFGINVETSHHEVGKGQYEIDFNYGTALETADKLLTLKYTVKKIAQMYNLRATFMPKPIKGMAGSGMHTHQSLFDTKINENLFFDKKDKYRLSKIAYNFIAGQLKHIKAMCAILCPTINSYKRLVTGYEAPVYVTWASMNRTTLIRVPNWFKQKPESARIELRCPDPTCNPYLAFAVMLKAGLDGIKRGLSPSEPFEANIFKFDDKRLAKNKIDILPTSLWEALNELKKDKTIQEVLGNHLFEKYIGIKTQEVNEYKMQVSDWEINRYLDMF
ncbi:MAG: type I glutamate--ammonia ligase, partial [Candidatus Marinimicrobia bacterium]|nr:type I glutamate--ammonia ligase [Candidatus Neomarinimicrobiota bacterium]